MRILQVGGDFFVARAFCASLHAQGAQCDMLLCGEESSPYIETISRERLVSGLREHGRQDYDAVLFHGTTTLAATAPPTFLHEVTSAFKLGDSLLLWYGYGFDKRLFEMEQVQVRSMLEMFDGILIGNAGFIERLPEGTRWEWLPLPVDFGGIEAPVLNDQVPEKVRMGVFPQAGCEQDRDGVIAALDELRQRYSNFTVVEHDLHKLTAAELRDELGTLNVLIEHGSLPAYGPLAVAAMARAITVVSGDKKDGFSFAPELEVSPVLGARRGPLLRRIEGIVKEPRCLKDLRVRSHSFVHHYHHSDLITARLLQLIHRLR